MKSLRLGPRKYRCLTPNESASKGHLGGIPVEFGDRIAAVAFFGRFRTSPTAMASLRRLLLEADGGVLGATVSRLSDEVVVEKVADLLVKRRFCMEEEPRRLQASAAAPPPEEAVSEVDVDDDDDTDTDTDTDTDVDMDTDTDTEAGPPPQIVRVQPMQGDDAEISADDKQWVNLTRDAKWVDGTRVTSLDRLTERPRVRVTFDRPGAHAFTLKIQPDAGNLAYSDAEKGRNDRFKYEEEEQSFTTEADGTKVIETMNVAVCGGHKYSLSAKDATGNEVSSQTIEVNRLVYYFQVKMTGSAAAGSVDTMVNEMASHQITMVAAGDEEMARMENISTGDSNTYKANVRTVYHAAADARDKEPYVLIVGYTDHLAVQDASQVVVKAGVAVGAGEVEIPIVNAAGDNKYLWQDIVTGEGWFVSCSYLEDGADAADAVAIAEDKCEAVAVSAARPSKSKKVKIDVSDLDAGTGTITLTVNWVNRMRGGLSFPGTNLICVCTKAWWREKSADSQNETIIHEMGHQFDMVVDGSGSGPDRVATQYDDSGHVGSHCHNGIAAQADYSDEDGSTCVIFGATNDVSTFCANCAPAVKKQDLGDGFGSL